MGTGVAPNAFVTDRKYHSRTTFFVKAAYANTSLAFMDTYNLHPKSPQKILSEFTPKTPG